MKTFCTAALLILLAVTSTFGAQEAKQKQSTVTSNTRVEANEGMSATSLDSGAQIDAEITSALDLKKAKPGDTFKLKTIKPIKNHGKEIISKGSTIIGHVQQTITADKTTRATLVFDQLVDNKTHLASSLSAVVTAIAKPVQANAIGQEDTMATLSPRAGATQQRTSQSGGLLGGVTQTAGGVTQTVGDVTQGAGGVAGQAGSTISSTTNATLGSTTGATGATAAVGGLTRGTIQIVNDTTTTAASGSTLTMASGNARLESGTRFMLQTTSALTLTKELKQK